MSRAARIVARLYAASLRLYPQRFHAEFGEEMRSVFEASVSEAAEGGWSLLAATCLREVRELPQALLREYWLVVRGWIEEAVVNNDIEGHRGERAGTEESASRAETLMGMVPILLYGIVVTLWALDRFWPLRSSLGNPAYWLFWTYVALIVGLTVGWIVGFPRWSYVYVGFVLAFGWYWSHMTTVGLRFFGHTFQHGERWGWRAWAPVAIVSAIALLVTRSLRPLARLVVSVWRDWTHLSFAVYGAVLAIYLPAFADELNAPIKVLDPAVLTIIMALGALVYLRGRGSWRRAVALQVGILGILLVAWASQVLWDGKWRMLRSDRSFAWYEILGSYAFLAVFYLGLMFFPAVVGLVRSAAQARRTA